MRIEPMPAWAAVEPALARQQGQPAPPTLNNPDRAEAQAIVARLQAFIDRKEKKAENFDAQQKQWTASRTAPRERRIWQLGLEAIDRNLPEGGLPRHALHEVMPQTAAHVPAAMGFATALALRRLNIPGESRPILWCRLERTQMEYGKLYGHGLENLGLARDRFLTVTLKKPAALFWTLEEALKSGCLAAAVGDAAVQQTSLTITRRLSLAATKGRSSALIVFAQHHDMATASTSRWQVATVRSQSPPLDGAAPGPPAWALTLSRIRSGKPGQWIVNWQKDHATHHFTLVSGISGGALYPHPQESPQASATAKPALRAG